MQDLIIRHLGLQPYLPIWQKMRTFTDTRNTSTLDEIWLLEHEPIFTLGQAGKTEHLLAPGDIPVIQVDRGGQVTYHGPGQLIVYVLIDIQRRKLGIRNLVTVLEQLIINYLASLNIEAHVRPGAPGVYVDQAKIASLGLRVRRGCTYHGLSFNIAMDLEPFSRINPCGHSGLAMTQLAELGGSSCAMTVANTLMLQLCEKLNYQQPYIFNLQV